MLMNMKLRILMLLVSSVAFGQAPRAYVAGSLGLMPAGYAATSFGVGGGIMFDRPYIVFDSYAGYDNGHKANDADNLPSSTGHDKYLRAFAGYKHGLWYGGLGARYSQLSTSDYTKGGDIFASGSWHPELGGGRDWNARTSPLFMRTQLLYMFREDKEVVHYPGGQTCYGCGNGSQGADITVWLPSPARKGHLFAKINAVLFAYHTTVTSPANILLTQQQVASKHFTDGTQFLIGWRF